MITNLLAMVTVCIVTNITMTNNAVAGYGADKVWKSVPATEKTEITEVVEFITIKLDPEQLKQIGWIGGFWEGTTKRVLSHKEHKMGVTEE